MMMIPTLEQVKAIALSIEPYAVIIQCTARRDVIQVYFPIGLEQRLVLQLDCRNGQIVVNRTLKGVDKLRNILRKRYRLVL